ncbi:alcohol dehydrogenase catalytic domain-containing protein [Agromyces sp. LHK192]|uniref:alcohol dehydrogenase catalytic domain-containing protein n=1 Tax=Agromyces sp. LHK192 TaxID=2498704 RepID=UPI000FDA5E35|nr:alcohol dehydrogenase catalytic domain-containing protein [Agromyces sp. LHK192]
MTATTAALVHERGGTATLSKVTIRQPGAHELVVRVMASGVCATDLFGIDGGAGDRFPAVFGHEGAGIVEAVGDGVTEIRSGDRVVLGFASCGDCDACLHGHSAYCGRFAELNYAAHAGATSTTGPVTTGWMGQSSWAAHVVVDARSAVVIGDDVPWAVAATLGCGVLTGAGAVLNVLRPGPGDTLLVIGAGTTGLAAVMAAKHRGVARIVVSDPIADRRDLAMLLGATEALAPDRVAEAVRGTASHVLDTVGTQPALDLALSQLATRGTCATVALKPGANRVEVSQSRLLWGRTLTGVIEGDADVARDIRSLAALWRAGRLPVEWLVATYPFADVAQAVEDARDGRVVKPVLRMGDERRVAPPAAPADLVETLRGGAVAEDDLAGLWRSLPPVEPAELRGLWRGTGLSPGHRVHRLLTRSGWYGKLFRSDDDVAPIVRTDGAGGLVSDPVLARGGASLHRVVHDGVATAAMVYDGQPVIDCFVRVGPDALLGVMTGRDTLDDGRAYHFLLERDRDRDPDQIGTAPAPAG